MGWGEPHARIPGIRDQLVEHGDLIPRERILQVLAVLGVTDPATVAALSIEQVTHGPGEWTGQVTIIRRQTIRRRIPGAGLNGPGHTIERTREHRQHIPIADTPEDT